jgi:hypothetical protein
MERTGLIREVGGQHSWKQKTKATLIKAAGAKEIHGAIYVLFCCVLLNASLGG